MPIVKLDYPSRKILMRAETDIENTYRRRACAKEPWTVEFVDRVKPGELFIDVGANVGPYTLIAATNGCRVMAIEPFFKNVERLCENLALNNVAANALVLMQALGERVNVEQFHISDMAYGSASHYLGDVGPRKIAFHMYPVLVTPLDTLQVFMGPGPRYIKIDTDGHEQQVLKGMTETLQQPETQAVLLEYRLKDEDAVLAFFASVGMMLVSKYDERDGKKLDRIAYGLFERG